jgi:hypothetical protein
MQTTNACQWSLAMANLFTKLLVWPRGRKRQFTGSADNSCMYEAHTNGSQDVTAIIVARQSMDLAPPIATEPHNC